jgi:hypothetical protein
MSHRITLAWKTALAAIVCTATLACQGTQSRPADATRPAASNASQSIEKAVAFLKSSQYDAAKAAELGMAAGDWPQFVTINASFVRATHRESSPFAATFVYDALCGLTVPHAARLGVSRQTIMDAARMRRACLPLFQEFAIPRDAPDEGVFGFWKERPRERTLCQKILGQFLLLLAGGPRWDGHLAPEYGPAAMPPQLMAWPDTDDTAAINACLLKAAQLGEFREPSQKWIDHMSQARDLAAVRRHFPSWLPPNSGAFTTWIAIPGRSRRPAWNDVDVLVNASALHALALAGRLDTPGADAAAALINRATAEGRHREVATATLYYPDTFFYHYLVSRAYAHGAKSLRPAMQLLVRDIESQIRTGHDGEMFCDRESPVLSTSLAALALLQAGESPQHPAIAGAIRFLIRAQHPDGGWDYAEFCHGETDNGVFLSWHSRATTTAFCLQALCRSLSASRH